jgi:hypothetical protein
LKCLACKLASSNFIANTPMDLRCPSVYNSWSYFDHDYFKIVEFVFFKNSYWIINCDGCLCNSLKCQIYSKSDGDLPLEKILLVAVHSMKKVSRFV